MSGSQNSLRSLIQGHPALIVIDIQAGCFAEEQDMSIPELPGYAEQQVAAA